MLAPEPDILLLDEPTNHLDLPAIEWLEGGAQRPPLGDRRHPATTAASWRTCPHATVWLDRGATRRLDKGFGHFEEWREQVWRRKSRAHKLGRKIARKEDWLRYGVTARRKRNKKRLGELFGLRARIRRPRRQRPRLPRRPQREAPHSGKLVIEAKNI